MAELITCVSKEDGASATHEVLGDKSGALDSSGRYRYFASTAWAAADLNLLTIGGRACRSILVLGDGNLDTVPEDPITSTPAASELIPALAGMAFGIRAITIKMTSTTVSGVLVAW